MFTLDELKLIMSWYHVYTNIAFSDKDDEKLTDKIEKLIAEMEEPV